jgi:hypothetical protein
MGATRRNLRDQPKILKKLSEHQIYQSEQKCSQKKYVQYLKSVKEPKICIGATRGNLQAQPKILKMTGTPNLPIKKKISQKKVCLAPEKCKGTKNSYGGYPAEFAPGA